MAEERADREFWGRLVRMLWIRWAVDQPDPKPSWLAPYDELTEADKEADRIIGVGVADIAMALAVRENEELRAEIAKLRSQYGTASR